MVGLVAILAGWGVTLWMFTIAVMMLFAEEDKQLMSWVPLLIGLFVGTPTYRFTWKAVRARLRGQ